MESKYIDLFKSDSSQEEVLNGFRNSIKDIKKLKDGDSYVLYNGSLDDMMRELK